MAAPSPRKFQEKIALLHQREAEGKAEFDQIMTEVQGLTGAMHQPIHHHQQPHHQLPQQQVQQQQQQTQQQHPPRPPQQQQHATRPPQGGSLPDFSINLTQGRGPPYYQQNALQGAVQDLQDLHEAVYPRNCVPHQRTSPATQVQHHPHNTNLTPSPRLHYHPTLLSPPEAPLPRSNSDSSLHQNLVQGKMVVNNRKVSAPAEMRTDPGFGMQFYDTHNLQQRPKPGCELTLPGDGMTINHIQRSPNIAIPTTINSVGGAGPGGGVAGGGGGCGLASTGSLPDLTQVQYLQPMNPPLPDTDILNVQNLSPRLGSGFTSGSLKEPYSSGQASPRGTSPGPSPSLNRKQKPKPYQPLHIGRGSHHSQNKNHLSVPSVVNARYLHTCKGMTVVDNSSTTVDTHLANSGLNMFGQPLSPNNSHPASPNHLSFMEYRNPVSPQLSPRSSPGPSHTLNTGGLGSYSSNSPSDSRSAPPSPSAPQASPASSPGINLSKAPFSYEYQTHAQTNQLNQQFEQCNMIDNSPGSNSSYTSTGNSTLQQQRLMDLSGDSGGSGYFSSANTASSSPSGPPPAYPNASSQQLTQNLSQTISQAHSQSHSQPTGPPPPYPQNSSTSPAHHQHPQQHQQTQQQQHQHRQQQHPPHSSPSHHPQHMSQSPSHTHHPPSPVHPINTQHPPSPGQCGPLSPQSNPSSIQHPPTPQTPQTPTMIPSVVLTMPDEAGTESERLLQDDMTLSEMFGNVISYEQGSFESDILENMSRLDENELSMMVEDSTVDQLLVDQETEESFRRDHRSASSTSSGP